MKQDSKRFISTLVDSFIKSILTTTKTDVSIAARELLATKGYKATLDYLSDHSPKQAKKVQQIADGLQSMDPHHIFAAKQQLIAADFMHQGFEEDCANVLECAYFHLTSWQVTPSPDTSAANSIIAFSFGYGR